METVLQNCPICETFVVRSKFLPDYSWHIHCNRCGIYFIKDSVIDIHLKEINERQKRNISSFLHNWPIGVPYSIDMDNIKKLMDLRDKKPLEKLDLILLFLYNISSEIGLKILLQEDSDEWISAEMKSWAISKMELKESLSILANMGYILHDCNSALGSTTHTIIFKPEGFKHVAELQAADENHSSRQAFVAMSFDPKLDHVYLNTIHTAIKNAGYEPFRIDAKDHTDKIDDQIIMEIRRSRFLVADFTYHRGGVYYEAGFAHALGLPVIFTCNATDFADLHFDVRQYNCISWTEDKLSDFCTAIQRRIEARLGHGDSSSE